MNQASKFWSCACKFLAWNRAVYCSVRKKARLTLKKLVQVSGMIQDWVRIIPINAMKNQCFYHLDRVLNRLHLSIFVHHCIRYVGCSDQLISRWHVTIQRVNDKLCLHVEILALSHLEVWDKVTYSDVVAQLLIPPIPSHQTHTCMYICPWVKKTQTIVLSISSSNIDQYLKFPHKCTKQEIHNKAWSMADSNCCDWVTEASHSNRLHWPWLWDKWISNQCSGIPTPPISATNQMSLERLVSEMTSYYVSSGTQNSTHSLTHIQRRLWS